MTPKRRPHWNALVILRQQTPKKQFNKRGNYYNNWVLCQAKIQIFKGAPTGTLQMRMFLIDLISC